MRLRSWLLSQLEFSTSRSSGSSAEGPLTATEIRDLARRHGIKPSKSLGQNFVVDPNTIRRIVRLAGVESNDSILEVGAGLGTLTRELARVGRRVLAVEFDRALMPALQEVLVSFENVALIQGDALELDYEALLGEGRWRLVSNLPYNITTPLVAEMLERVPQIEEFVVLVQREVGQRLIAGPGSKTYGAVSVLVAFHSEARMLGRVPSTVFWPKPAVESVLIRLIRKNVSQAIASDELMLVVRAAFAQRRKTIRNSLASKYESTQVENALVVADIEGSRRAEDLALQEFIELAMAFR